MSASHRVERVVFHDKLGYAVVYYQPIGNNQVKVPRSEDILERRRKQVSFDDPKDEIFCAEVEAMVRKRERESASKEIENICEKIEDMFNQVEECDLKNRDILNQRVREQIRGKSADDICDIILKDVYNHTNPIYNRIRRQDTFPHKMKYKILAAGLKRCPSPPAPRLARKILDEELEHEKNRKLQQESAIKRVEAYMDEHVMTNVYGRKYKKALDRIQDDIKVLKRRCTDKIDFPK
jgi:hypothetical protein